MLTINYLQWSIFVLIIVIGIMFFQEDSNGRNKPVSILNAHISDVADEIMSLGKPVVIRESEVRQWKALKLWNPTYIQQKLTFPLQKVHIHSEKSIVFYEEGAPMVHKDILPSSTILQQAAVKWKRSSKTIQSMSAQQFISKATDTYDKSYYYWNGELPANLLSDVTPYKQLTVGGKSSLMYLWIGEKGVTAHTHYDIEHNFYVQVYGRKKWTIWEPEAHSSLYLYPRLSPNYRQSQVDLQSPLKYPRFNQSNHYEVILEEGDVLYLPPFYFHRVESYDTRTHSENDLIIAVNFWGDSIEHTSVKDLYDTSFYLPFVDKDDNPIVQVKQALSRFNRKDQQHIAAYHYLSELTKKVTNRDSNDFFKELYDTRYSFIFDPLLNQVETDCPPSINIDEISKLQTVVDKMIQSPIIHNLSMIKSQGIKEIHLSNYIEDVLSWLVDIPAVPSYLKYCYAYKK